METGSIKDSAGDSLNTRYATILTVTSGKGGVGKTQICANLAVSLAELGQKVCIVDADHGLANINIVLGIPANSPHSSLSSEEIHHQLYQKLDPLPFVLETNLGIDLLPSISGLNVNTEDPKQPSKEQISQMLVSLRVHYDVILIDTAAGINANVKNYVAAADHTLVIINTEPTSLTDSFGLIRRMQNVTNSFEVIVNRVPNAEAATKIFKRFSGAVNKYIGCELSALGYIREDTLVSAALLSQRVLIKYSPNCLAGQCINQLASKLIKKIESTTILHKTKIKPNKPSTTESPTLSAISITGNPQAVFDNWLGQIGQLINNENLSLDEKKLRIKKLMSQLEIICEKDKEFLTALESLVISIGIGGELEQCSDEKSIPLGPNLSRFNISKNSILS